MTAIPNTIRRGAVYWYRRSRRLPSGKSFRPVVSLRTACPNVARRRAAILSASFEELYMRLFGNPGRRFALDADSATRIFQREFNLALDALEDERERSRILQYEFDDFPTFLDVHEQVYLYLAETNCSADDVTAEALAERMPTIDGRVIELVLVQLRSMSAIWHKGLDETAAALEAENLGTDIFHMDHAMRLRFEARLAAAQEYRRRLTDPKLRFDSLLAASPVLPQVSAAPLPVAPIAPVPPASPIDPRLAGLTAEEFGARFIEENPKLQGSSHGKREARWTDKTRSQFETAMRLLQKSMGTKPFVSLANEDLKRLLEHFDGLPPNHHKSPRHGPMTLDEICAEATREIADGKLDSASLGLNVPTLNRHFRFIRMAHDWLRAQAPEVPALNWKAYSFEDGRTAREQREAFPVDVARRIFRLPPWHGCLNIRQRLKPGREIFHDSLYWVLPIIWYSGMRREEACKLQVCDIARGDDGIWYFNIVDSESGRLKNRSSRRLVPVADELLRLGLVEFVAAMKDAGQSLLFPELASDTRRLGDTFYRLAWNKILAALDNRPDDLTLHGIRHTVANELKAAGISEEVRADLLGHTLESETAGRYSKGSRLDVLQDAVNRIPVVTMTVKPHPIRLTS